jgi:hypothetical protein
VVVMIVDEVMLQIVEVVMDTVVVVIHIVVVMDTVEMVIHIVVVMLHSVAAVMVMDTVVVASQKSVVEWVVGVSWRGMVVGVSWVVLCVTVVVPLPFVVLRVVLNRTEN